MVRMSGFDPVLVAQRITRTAALNDLERRYLRQLGECSFFFPPEGDIRGFWGLADWLTIVAPCPSESEWDYRNEARRLLYDTVRSNGASDCPITDIVKQPMTLVEFRNLRYLSWHIGMLGEELRIRLLTSSFVIAVGVDAARFLSDHSEVFPAGFSKHRIAKVMHFSYFRHVDSGDRDAVKEQFRTEFRSAVQYVRRSRSRII